MALIHDNSYFLQKTRVAQNICFICAICVRLLLREDGARRPPSYLSAPSFYWQELHKYTVLGSMESIFRKASNYNLKAWVSDYESTYKKCLREE